MSAAAVLDPPQMLSLVETRDDAHPKPVLGHVQVPTGAQRFATVSGLNDMFPGNGVQRGLRYVFSSAATCKHINHAVLKRQLAQWVQVKSFTNVSAAYTTIEDIRRHVCCKSFIVTAYQHDDDEFVSKCN